MLSFPWRRFLWAAGHAPPTCYSQSLVAGRWVEQGRPQALQGNSQPSALLEELLWLAREVTETHFYGCLENQSISQAVALKISRFGVLNDVFGKG